jgi:AbrB family looped-hinge helix DNA binding protein
MTYTVTITSQGQISIPARFRRELELEHTRKAHISKEGGRLILEPIKDLLSLGGSLKTNKKPLSNKELDETVGEAIAEEYAKKLKRM